METLTVDETFERLCSCLRVKRRVESVSELFAKQTTDSDRVEIAMQLLKEHNLIVTHKRFVRDSDKSFKRSLDLRNSGNKSFQMKDDRAALKLYTQSIATAPFPGTSKICNQELQTQLGENGNDCTSDALALALANRSAVFFSMGNHEACLNDIRQAMKYNYPKKLLYKLFERQGKCLQALGRIASAMESLYDAQKWLPSASGLTEEKKQAIGIELRTLVQNLANSKPTEVSCCNQIRQPPLPSCSYSKNHEILCASDCVELKFMPDMGRYIAATRDIQPGDILAVEKPFASVLLPDYYGTHCYNCLQHSQSLLPCYHCSTVMYCSEECRTSSWINNHYIDCPLLGVLQKLELGILGFLALRIIIKVCKGGNLDSLLKSVEGEGRQSDKNKGFNNNGTYSSSDYRPIYWLVGNTEKRSVADLFKRAVIAACILNCLETMTDFFPTDATSPSESSHQKLVVGGLLLRHMQNLPCNAHEVSDDAGNDREGVPMWKTIEIGAAAYAMLSLVNHSCDPNVVRHSYQGDTAVLWAIRPIAKGEQSFKGVKKNWNDFLYSLETEALVSNLVTYIQVLDNYGYHYALHDRAERRSHLEMQYYFTCRCIACTEDWPKYSLLPDTNPTYLCTRCRHTLPVQVIDPRRSKVITCTYCSEPHNMPDIISKIKKSSEEFSQNLNLIMSGKDCCWEELTQRLICHLQLLDRFIQQPWREYNNCQEAIKQCLAMKSNCYRY